MKKGMLLLVMVCITTLLLSQKVFEGKIIYQVLSGDGNESALIEVLFGKDKIRTSIIVNNHPQNATGDLLFDFSNGVAYSFPYGSKEYKTDSIPLKLNGYKSQQFKATAKVLNISGNSCKAYINITTDEKRFIVQDKMLVHWFADSLFFPVAAKFAINEEMSFLTNGQNIGLGMGTQSKNGDGSYSNKFSAISVDAMPLPDSLFKIPNDYILTPGSFYKTNTNNKNVEVLDIKMEMLKPAPSPPPPPAFKPKAKTTKKAAKTALLKPKQ